MGRLFGTDGVRGVANRDLTPEMAYSIGRAAAYVLHGERTGSVFIGRDTRYSGDLLFASLSAGLMSMGVDVYDLGVLPTPAVSYLTMEHEVLMSIMISASHNPYEYNGIKIFNNEGFKLSDEIEKRIEDIIIDGIELSNRPSGEDVGRIFDASYKIKDYEDYILDLCECDLSDKTIALDCGNGALSKIAPEIFNLLGAKTIAMNTNPDGKNINDNCGSTNPELISKLVLETNAFMGFSFDGDADRIIAVDEKGDIIDGDHILAITAKYLIERDALPKDTVVGTVMTNMGLDVFMESIGGKVIKTKVGDRYVLEEMLKSGYTVGGEQSGHIIYLDNNTTGDGLATAIQLLNYILEMNQLPSELNGLMKNFPQVLLNANVKNENKYKYMEVEEIKMAIAKIEEKFHKRGRVVIRPSGTEPLVRVMIEGEDKDMIKAEAKNLVNLIEEKLGGTKVWSES
ncbi:MAG: phosphoglucosamine mutase [Tissierellia bacterium]|nr:phosphoglucosamine mutase [Tissierellia bacterium]